MKRILVTGTHSGLGNALVRYLSQWPEAYMVDRISLRDAQWKNADFSQYDAIYHTAALVHHGETKDDPACLPEYRRVNVELTLEAAEKAKAEGVGQFVFLSSLAVYGLTAPYGKVVMIDENTPLKPSDNYGITKAEAEAGLTAMETDSFRVAILRPPMVYGQDCKGNYNTLSRLARKVPLFPYVKNQRSMLYAGNLCELVRLLIENHDRGIFCPQNAEYVSTCDLIREIGSVHGKKILFIPGFGWCFRILRRFAPAVDKAFGSLCYSPSLSTYRQNYCIRDLRESVLETEK